MSGNLGETVFAMKPDINPRYACYCAAHGETSAEAMIARAKSYPREPGLEQFPAWNTQHIREFFAQAEGSFFAKGRLIGDDEHIRYDAWLQAKYPGYHHVAIEPAV